MRVLHINSGNLYGGVETFLSTLAECRNLAPSMDPEFALCFAGRQENELRASGVPVHRLGEVRFRHPWTVWRSRAALRRLLASDKFDVVICHQPWIQALYGRTVKAARKAYVAYFHGPAGTGWPERRCRRTNPDLIVAPSRHSLSTVADWFPSAVQAAVNYPLPVRLQNRKVLRSEERESLRSQCGAKPSEIVIFMATRVEGWKGPDLVVRSLGLLRDEPNWRFWFAGGVQRAEDQALLDTMKQIARESGIEDRVVFLGERTDVPLLMQAADIFTQGNRTAEGFGLSFLEASYSGVPIVTTVLGAAGDAVDDSNGLLVPPENAAVLAEAFRRLIRDAGLRHGLGCRGRERSLKLYDPKTQLNRLAELFQDAATATRAQETGS